jgi:hypothetical protein
MEISARLLKKLKTELPCDPALPVPDTPWDTGVSLHRHLCNHVYRSTVHNSQATDPLRCPSTGEWMTKIWFVHNGVLFSIKVNESMPFAGKWIELEMTVLSKIIHTQRDKCACFPSYVDSRSKIVRQNGGYLWEEPRGSGAEYNGNRLYMCMKKS